MVPIRVVHLVAKTHLDLGFTALAAEVEEQYLADFFPRALRVAAELRDRGGPEQLTWTTGSWILDQALADADASRSAAVEAGVRDGTLAWHALPLTFHTELMDVGLFRSGLSISQDLDQRFGRTTTAAKMTDVPGHTRGMVPLLAEAGVTFLHLGVNPAWPVPDVPPVFRWRSPDGTEVTVAYQAGGYGGEVVIDGCDEVLAFLHAGDNLGPPSVDDVLAAHADLRARYPEAEVRASTLDAFARAVEGSGAVDRLPVVTAEIGDPWIFGAGSDPQKVSAYRKLLGEARMLADAGRRGASRAQQLEEVPGGLPPGFYDRARSTAAAMYSSLLGVAEHTWGLDEKMVFPTEPAWDATALAAIRASEVGARFERSWDEQWDYVRNAAWALGRHRVAFREMERESGRRSSNLTAASVASVYERPARSGHEPPRTLDAWGWTREPDSGPARSIRAGEVVCVEERWEIAIDRSGAVVHLVDLQSGRVRADEDHPLGRVTHQTFDEADYEHFYAGLTPAPEDDWWARRDNAKPGIDESGAVSARTSAELVDAWFTPTLIEGRPGAALTSYLRFSDPHLGGMGAPPELWVTWQFEGAITCFVSWPNKPASRLPEATWVSFNPIVAEPERWELDKLGQRISPLDVVRHGGRSLHGVGEGMHYDGPDGRLTIASPDAPLVAPGAPNLLDADPPVPDLSGGFHVLLHDNCWGTNFPMWNEGPARFRFGVRVG